MSETTPTASTLHQSIDTIEGVGPTRAKAFRELGVDTVGDLLEYFPRDYQFETSERSISDLSSEQIQIARGEVVAVDYVTGGRPRFEATLDDGTGKLALVWFNGAYLRRRIHPGMNLLVKGPVRFFHNIPQMTHAEWKVVDDSVETVEESKLRPIYPASSRLTSKAIEAVVETILPGAIRSIDEWFTPEILTRRKLLSRREALRAIHQPRFETEARRARQRLMFDELMLMQLGLALSKRLRDGRLTAPVVRIDKLLDERIRKRFPFEMTEAQRRTTWEILNDLKSGKPMNRLLQGDVGSGKTAVAVYAMLASVANKLQSAILAPTEVLAEQHFLTLSNLLRDSSVTIELYTHRTKRQSKGAIVRALADGRVHLAVGTQALLQDDIEFANLGLVVIDEQHRLGVRQRAMLRSKGLSPHYLVMTATPIPRTLALSYFADFDLSVIDELPPGRTPIVTRWLRYSQSGSAYEFVRQQVGQGRQVYIVVPQVEDNGLDEAKSVVKESERLAKGPLAGLTLATLHGQMATEEKNQAMQTFRSGQTQVLVATTVIEVGVDVPNATVMLIDNADRFGLSQLHQLRGRVGRGAHASHCLLLSDATSEESQTRLNTMCRTNDGFEIAEMDLQLRGPGEFFGTRQHGLPEFKLADLSKELEMLEQAKEDALELLSQDPKLTRPEHRALRDALREQFRDTLELAGIG